MEDENFVLVRRGGGRCSPTAATSGCRSSSTPSTSSPTRRRTTSCCSSRSTRSTSSGSSSCSTRCETVRDALVATRADERRTRPLVRPAPAQPDARDRAGAGAADRRARDDDAAGLPGVPAAARAGERLPVGAVPRAGVPLRRQGRGLRRTGSGASPTLEKQRLARRLEEPTLWDGFVHVLGEAGAGHLLRRGDHRLAARRSPTTGRRTPTSGDWPRRCSSTTSSPPPGARGTS